MIRFNSAPLTRTVGSLRLAIIRALVALLLLGCSSQSLANYNIVALLSYDPSLDWSQEFTKTLISEAGKHRDSVNIYIEYLDSQRIPEPMWASHRADFLRGKYRSIRVDAVMAESNHAARFLSAFGTSVFGQTPQISVSENRYTAENSGRNLHIPLLPDFQQSLRFASKLRPDPELIAIIGDRSAEASALASGLQQAAARQFPDAAMELRASDDLAALIRYVAALPKSTLLFHTLYYQPHSSAPEPAKAAAILSATSSVPMLVSYKTLLTAGASGGVVITAEQAAKAALQSALSFIEPPFRPHSHQVSVESWINYPQLKRFNVPARLIPPGSQIIDAPKTVPEPDHYQSAGIFIFILLQLGLLLGLSILLRQRNQLTRSLLDINGQLEDKVAERTRELKILASTDSLTGLYNRMEFSRQALAAINQAQRNSSNLCVAIIDLDHFKRVNDQFGHTAGDRVLKEVALRIQQSLRSYDIVGRYGGEEFSVVLPGSDLEQAVTALNKVRLAIAGQPIGIDSGRSLHVSMSAGVAVLANPADNLGSLIKAADSQLYLAKANGRNQVCSKATEAA